MESAPFRYGLAVLSVSVALALTYLLHPDALIMPSFFLAIILSAWVGGIGPGLLAALLATLSVVYFFLPPTYSLRFDLVHLPQLLVFIVSAVLVSSWSAARKRAETLLRQARDEQEAKVQERTADLKQANEKLQEEIAERRRVEETLRERASLLDLTHDTVFSRDMNDVITYWNRGAEELYGWTSEEATGQVSHRLTQTIFPAPLEEINEQLFDTGRWEGELIHAKRDGSRVVVASRWSLQRDERGRPLAILETNNDITERRSSERRYQHIFQAVGVSIWEEDFSQVKAAIDELQAEGVRDFRRYLVAHPEFVRQAVPLVKIVDVNDATVKLFAARSKDELLGSLDKIFLPETEEVFAGELIALAEGRTSFESETILQTLKGDKLTVLFTITFPPQPANLDSVLVTITDITERKHAEEALQKAQAELAHITRVTTMGELASSIAHEVNQPLAAIVTNGNAALRWLAAEPPNLDEARESVGRIVRDGHRASEVVGRVRALFRKAATAKERLDINDLIQDVLALVPGELRRNHVQLRTVLAHDLPQVVADRVQLQQVLLNLIINAVEAMSTVADRQRRLLIRSQRADADGVLVSVEDSGVGIGSQNPSQLFDAFFTTKPDGLGMGLSISRTTIEAHGGRLWATANDGTGATFQFTLPVNGENA
jgi:PAS domain S-box-containing protein